MLREQNPRGKGASGGTMRLPGRPANQTGLGALAVGVLASMLAACSADLSLNNLTLSPKAESMPKRPDGATQAWARSSFDRTIIAADLVGPDGQCPSGPQLASGASGSAGVAAPGPDQAAPMLGGISLRMTECEVVRRAGPVEKADLAANERGERSLVLTYLQGPSPGIYRFTGGRLLSIERVPAPPLPGKPQKATGGGKKPPGS
jgi:hypothetical protein